MLSVDGTYVYDSSFHTKTLNSSWLSAGMINGTMIVCILDSRFSRSTTA